MTKIVWVATVVMAMVSGRGLAETWTDDRGFTWSYEVISDNEAMVTGISPTSGEMPPIPSELGGKAVTSIRNYAFSDCYGLTGTLMIPSGVTSIGEGAFYECSGLTSVTIPDGVMCIAESTFAYCSGLTSVTIPSSVTSIGDYAFADCSGLTSVMILDGVTSIGEGAFTECSGLTCVTIPNSVTSIGMGAFFCCYSLYDLNSVPGVILVDGWGIDNDGTLCGTLDLTGVRGIGDQAFYGCSGLTSVTIPSSVKSIGWGAFEDCSELASVTIGDGVTCIENYTFIGCCGLMNVTIPNSVTNIGVGAFKGCSGLTSVTIPSSVASIGQCAFEDCSGLTSVTICGGVMSIGYQMFSGCSGLTNVTIPNSVTNIGEGAFHWCNELTSFTIPDGVTSIAADAFYGCDKLNEYVVSENNQQYRSVDGLLLSKDGKTLIYAPGALTSIAIPDGIVNIGEDAFFSCRFLANVTIPSSVKNIGDWAFEECSALTSVTIPEGITNIGEYAFTCCSGLTSVTIPSTVTSIGKRVFEDCSGLTSVTIPNSVTNIGDGAFSGCSGLTSVTIPDSVKSIGEDAFSGCSELTNVTIGNGVTDIGSAAFWGCSGLTAFAIPASLSSIGEQAFSGCRSMNAFFVSEDNPMYMSVDGLLLTKDGKTLVTAPGALTSATISFGVTNISDWAFDECSRLTRVTIPNSVMGMGAEVFWRNCPRLELVVAPCSLEGNPAFENAFFRIVYYDGSAEDLSWYTLTFNVNGGDVAVSPMTVLGGYAVDAVGAMPRPKRPGYAFTGWFTLGGNHVTGDAVVTDDMSLYAHWEERGPEITYELHDFWGDGWNGNAIMVVDVATGEQVDYLTIEDGDYSEGTISVVAGMQVRFEWVQGDREHTTSFTVKGVNGEVILTSSCGGFGDSVTYVVPSRSPNEAPSVTVDETRMLEPVVSDVGMRIIAAKEGETLDQGDVASVRIASPADPAVDITAAYMCALDSANNQIVVTLLAPEMVAIEEENKATEDATGILEDVSKVAPGKIAALPTPDSADPAKSDEVGALPVKMYKGLWYRAWWGDDLSSLSPGTKFRADGTQTHIGVIKQTGHSGFYKVSVSEK